MPFVPNKAEPPLFVIAPGTDRSGGVQPPASALPLIAPITEKQQPRLKPKPYRILQNIRSISSCIHRNAAIDTDDVLWTWGAPSIAWSSECKAFSIDLSQHVDYIPKKQMENVSMVSAGAWHTLCITKDKKLWSWGKNKLGELGQGDFEERPEPTFLMDGVIFACANECQSFAIKEDHSLWGWGYNRNWVLHDAPEKCNTPFRLTIDAVQAVSADSDCALAIKEDHSLWGWGNNAFGVLFTEHPHKKYVPTMLMQDIQSISISASTDGYALLVTDDGDLYSVGISDTGSMVSWKMRQEQGQRPIKLMEGVADATAGHLFALIRTIDGRLYAAGNNELGQCGNGKSTGWLRKPTQIMSHVKEVVAGHFHGMALQENGDLWIWGGDYGISAKPL